MIAAIWIVNGNIKWNWQSFDNYADFVFRKWTRGGSGGGNKVKTDSLDSDHHNHYHEDWAFLHEFGDEKKRVEDVLEEEKKFFSILKYIFFGVFSQPWWCF